LLESLTPVVDLRVSPAEPGQRFTSALVRFASKRDADDAIVVFDFYNFTSSCGATGSLRLERASYPDSHQLALFSFYPPVSRLLYVVCLLIQQVHT
jgi:hypothetical protein